MAKSHPAQSYQVDAFGIVTMARCPKAVFVLLACLCSLTLFSNVQTGASRTAVSAVHVGGVLETLLPATSAGAVDAAVVVDPDRVKYRVIGDYLAQRYRVSKETTFAVVAKAYTAAADLKLDPMLILAVIGLESRFNPDAESVMGAKGLMQIIPRFHSAKFEAFGGEEVAFDLQANIQVGAMILKEYLRRTGDLGDALQLYVGASSEVSENGYVDKVLAEKDRLHQILRKHERLGRTALRQAALKRPVAVI